LAVDADCQRQGIGRELIRRTHELAGLHTTLIVLGVQSAKAQPPTYLVLRAPVTQAPRPHGHHLPPQSPAAYGYMLEPRPYAYGWFGASPRPQWSRHFGYYRNYTEWSAR